MQVRFLSDGSEYRSYGGGGFSNKKESGGIFWWTILITLLMGAATFCWFFSIMVFAHPEKPFNYRLLSKLEKVEPLRPFPPYYAPNGRFVTAKQVLTDFYAFTPEQMAVKNDLMKRAYIKNYTEDDPIYVKGEFIVSSARQLNDTDVMTGGWVVRARAVDMEDVDVELLMPGLKGGEAPYSEGDSLVLTQKSAFAAMLHVQKLKLDRVSVTLIPITYQGIAMGSGKSTKMTPPELLNMDAFWPVTKDPGITERVAVVPEG
jgi:hypothetical protein